VFRAAPLRENDDRTYASEAGERVVGPPAGSYERVFERPSL